MTEGLHAVIETDVLIVGAGPTGLLLANLLGTMGVPTTIVERNADTVHEPRGVSLDDESMRALQAVGLSDEVGKITVHGYGSIYKGPTGKVFATVKPSVKEYGFDKRNAFQQPVLEGLLRKSFERHKNLMPFFSTELTGFEQSANRVTATIQSPNDGTRQISARYMVACDGARSQVRKSLGIEMKGSTFAEPWLIVDLKTTRNRCFHTEVFCDPARPCITLPGPDGIRRYEFKLQEGEDPESAEEEGFVRKLLSDFGPDAKEAFRRVQVYTFHARIAECWRQGRTFLAGDAAHLTPPFAGQGMNSGLRDAHNLAWKLAEAIHFDDADALLDSYEKERSPHAWSMIMLALRLGQVMMPTSRIQGAMVRGAFNLLGLYPPARDYFSQMRFKPKPRFKDGLIWPDSRDAKKTLVGQMISQPVMETVDRDHVLLDDILPDRPVVLVYAQRPDELITKVSCQKIQAQGATVIGVTPEGTNPARAHFPIARDQSRFFAQRPYIDYLGYALLLRRDRYIAASKPVGDVLDLLIPLMELTAQADHHAPQREQMATKMGDSAPERKTV